MHVAVLTPWWPSRHSPTLGAFVQQDVKALRSVGHKVTVITVRLPGWLPRRARDLLFGLIAGVRLAFVTDFEVIHAYNVLPAGLVAAVYAWMGLPAILVELTCPFSLHTRGRWSRNLVSWVLRRVPVHAGCGPQLAQAVGGTVFPCVVDVPEPALRHAHSGPVRLLAVGRLDERKGFRFLRDVWEGLDKDERSRFDLVVIGDGPLSKDLRAAWGITVLPALPFRAQYLGWLQWADLVLVPSREEGMGLVACEAAAMGCTVVASDTGIHPDLPIYHMLYHTDERVERDQWRDLLRQQLRNPLLPPTAKATAYVSLTYGPAAYVRNAEHLYSQAKEGRAMDDEGETLLRNTPRGFAAAADFVCSIGCMVVILLGLPFILARAALQRTNKLDSEGGKRSLKDGQRAA